MSEVWTIEELKALTNEISTKDVEYRGKNITVQWCELTEAEEPKMALPSDDLSEDDKNIAYQKIGSAKVLAMIEKANTMNPDGVTIDASIWEELPSTLRYSLSTVVLGGDSKSDF
tara:strand:- start:527 stop:871 length:345 start_codon:yes stop_codon:yes gene_type:complete